MSFSNLELHSALLNTLSNLNYTVPTPVQLEVIPKVLQGYDLRVSAPTGTGKTAAFLLPSLTKLIQNPSTEKKRGPRVLILVPTRELAIQVATQANKYSKALKNMKTVTIYGGVPYPKQNRELREPHEIIVATPGRLIDHLEQNRISFERVDTFILDEADRMLDMGFSKAVQNIASKLPKKRQTLLFSATLKGNVMELSNRLLTKALEINIDSEDVNHENVDQRLFYVDDINHKEQILEHLLEQTQIEQAIVFTATKRQADKLAKILKEKGHSVGKIHGDIHQDKRTKTILKLRHNQMRILVATDVAARGIDVKTISHVINFDLPDSNEDYIHRIGRTARAGATGTTITFATHRERSEIFSIENFTGKKMTCDVIEGLEPKKKMSDKPAFKKKDFRKSKGRNSFPQQKNRHNKRRSNSSRFFK